jgi:8-oxoguanine DNA-glycosylase Ogg
MSLCRAFGDPFAGGPVAGVLHYGFPPTHRLAEASLPQMERCGLGFRARYIKDAARQILSNGGAQWLASLRDVPYAEARAALKTLPGIGDKIADCICLFSLDKDEAVPVDTHIRQIAARRFHAPAPDGVSGNHRPRAKKTDTEIGDLLRAKFGPMAGWAQQYLFFGDLYERGAWKSYTAQTHNNEPPTRPLTK